MRQTYKTIKGDEGVDFANMARQLAAELRVGIITHMPSPVFSAFLSLSLFYYAPCCRGRIKQYCDPSVCLCLSVCPSLRCTAALGYRHAGCLQLSHVQTVDPSMDGRRSAASRTAISGVITCYFCYYQERNWFGDDVVNAIEESLLPSQNALLGCHQQRYVPLWAVKDAVKNPPGLNWLTCNGCKTVMLNVIKNGRLYCRLRLCISFKVE